MQERSLLKAAFVCVVLALGSSSALAWMARTNGLPYRPSATLALSA